MQQVRLAPNTANETVIGADSILSSDFSKTHTGLSDYRIRVGYNPELESRALDEMFLEKEDGTLLFRGLLESVNSNEGNATTTLAGHGVGYKLETSEVVFSVTNELAHDAIERFWSSETVFTPTVTEPSISNTVSGESTQEANTTSEFDGILSLSDTDPFLVQNDNVELQQTSFTVEAEDFDRETGRTLTSSEPDYSDGNAIVYGPEVSVREWDFNLDYTIPEGELVINYRNEGLDANGTPPTIEWYIDDEFVGRTNTLLSLEWAEVFTDGSDTITPPELTSGTHTLRAEQQVETTSESFTASFNSASESDIINGSFNQAIPLTKVNVVPSSETVQTTDGSTTFTEGTDYDIDYELGIITILPNAGMSENTDYTVDYDYYTSGASTQLTADSIVPDTETVSDGSGTEFTKGEDYRIDYDDGTITPLLDGSLVDGTSYNIEYDNVDGNGSRVIDVVAPADGRFSYTLDNDNGGSSGYLDGPELYPITTQEFDTATTSWNITDATLTTSWDDTSNGQAIQLQLDTTWFPNDGTQNNTTSVTTDFGTEVSSSITGRATFSRYGSRTTATPQTGFNGQKLQSWEITFDGNDRPVIGDDSFEGSELQVAQQLHQRADMRFTLEHEKSSLPVESYRAGDVQKTLPELDIKNRSEKTDLGPYFNAVTVRGQRVDGDRQSHTVESQTEINDKGRRHFDTTDPSLDTLEKIKIAARALLVEKIREQDKKGVLEVVPVDVSPGYSYDNPFDTGTIPIEEISYRVRNGELSGRLTFDYRVSELQLGEDIGGLRKSSRNTKLGF